MAVHFLDYEIQSNNYSTNEMKEIFDERNRFKRWMKIEVILSEVESDFDIIPKRAADHIRKTMDNPNINWEKIAISYSKNFNSLIPVLDEVRRLCGEPYNNYLHYGTTTQDIIDTSQMLEIKEAIKIFDKKLSSIKGKLIKIIEESGNFSMIGRSHGQYAVPITLGYKLTIWLCEIERHIERLKSWRKRGLKGQFGGATGSHNLLGEKGVLVGEKLMEKLGLNYSKISWQNSRDDIAEFASILSLISGSMDKISGEIYLLGKTDVAEIREGKTKEAGSSTMPHKKNPVLCERIGAISYHINAMVQVILNTISHEHERDPRKLWAEWLTIPSLCIYLDFVLSNMDDILTNLCIYPDTMMGNLNKYKNEIISEYVLSCLTKTLDKKVAKEVLNDILSTSKNNKKDIIEIIKEDTVLQNYFDDKMLFIIANPHKYNGICESVKKILYLEEKRRKKMKISVKYLTKVQKILGKKKEGFEINEETTIKSFIDNYLLREHDALKELFFSNNTFNDEILIFLNDSQEDINSSTKLCEGDNLTFMVAISGG